MKPDAARRIGGPAIEARSIRVGALGTGLAGLLRRTPEKLRDIEAIIGHLARRPTHGLAVLVKLTFRSVFGFSIRPSVQTRMAVG
jgi:hypothetical protein